MADVQDGEEEFRPRCVKTFMDGDRLVAVHVEHMIGDHWWVMVHNIRSHETEAEFDEYKERSLGRRPTAAIARIIGSSNQILLKGCRV